MIRVIPTDTIYGITAPALDRDAVEQLYAIKGRRPDKPTAILIHDKKDLNLFGVKLTKKQKSLVKNFWPGSVTLIFKTKEKKKFEYLHRGTGTLAFRVSKDPELQKLLEQTGPLAASSTNPEGKPPATSIAQAKKYFGKKVKEYVDGGILDGKPSSLVSLVDDKPAVLRQGKGLGYFHEKVIEVVRNIPRGSTMTYGEVAKAARAPGAARRVGTVVATNFDPSVPCHRVLKSDGSIGEYNRGGTKAKRALLKEEGAL